MRPRRFAAGVAALALAGAIAGAILALRPPSGHTIQLAPTARPGIARIPGMRLVSSDHSKATCSYKVSGPELLPQVCDQDVTSGLDQIWALSGAVAKYGKDRAGSVPPLAFAKQHPGPAMVTDEVRTLYHSQGHDLAEQLLHSTAYTDFDTSVATPAAEWAINGGLAEALGGPAIPGMNEFRFAWASGTSVVMVNVLGVDLTAGEAQRIAGLAGPRG
jgi:hypothetical protein